MPTSAELKRALLCGTIAVALFIPTLRYDLVWDDPISLQRWLPALDSVSAVFFPPANVPQFPADYYRPLQLLSYKVDTALGGGEPWVFHGSSVAWHGLVTILMVLLGRWLWVGMPIASRASVASAVLFAVHPIHSESIAWMAARPDPMVAGFSLAALYLLVTARRTSWPRMMGAALLVFAALLSKETGVAVLVLLPLAVWLPGVVTGKQQSSQAEKGILWATVAVTALAAVFYGLLRQVGLTHYRGSSLIFPESFLFSILAAVGWYVWKLFWPFPQNAFVPEVPQSPWYVVSAGVALLGTIVGAIAAFRKRQLAPLFAVAWFWCTLIPCLVLLALQPAAPVAERYLYLPSIGFSWLAGDAIARLTTRLPSHPRHLVVLLGVVGAAALAVATWERNQIWQDNVSLWADTAAKNPHHSFPLRNLAAALLERGRVDDAERLLREALARPNTPAGLHAIYSNLGTVAFVREDYERAAEYYRTAFEHKQSPDIAYNLAAALLKSAEEKGGNDKVTHMRQARQWMERALSMSPYDAEVHFGYAEVVWLLGEKELALQHFRRSLELGLREPQAERARSLVHGSSSP